MRFLFTVWGFVSLLGCSENKKTSTEQVRELRMDQYKTLADSNYQMGNFENTVKYFSKVIVSDSINGEFFYKRGFSYAKLNDFKNSSEDFLKAVKYEYRTADAYYMLGINQIAFLNDSLAIFYLEKSLVINPKAQETMDALTACKKKVITF